MTYGMNGWNKEIPGGDMISRAAAIEALGEKPLAWMESEYAQGLQNQWVFDVNALRTLPAAQPEPRRKKGRWSGSCCSVCGVSRYNFINILHTDSGYRGTWKYCPNCGAEMEVIK